MNLFAGPCDSEFGHELFSFQGYVRHLSKRYDKTVVCSKKSMRFLYKDFADHFLPLEQYTNTEKYSNYKFINYKDFLPRYWNDSPKESQSFIKYGSPIAEKYDVIFHARKKNGLCKNLSNETYDNLYELLKDKYSVSFIGTKEASYCPSGALDLRGIELESLANIFSSSRLVVGNSSGPIHFASLCGTAHLTWGGYRSRTLARYAHLWNPLKTKCHLFEDLTNINYLKRRLSSFGVPRDVLHSNYFFIVDTKEYREPSVKLLYNTIEGILSE